MVNIQVGLSICCYSDYVICSWLYVLLVGCKCSSLDVIVILVCDYDIVGLQEVDLGSLCLGFINQIYYLVQCVGFNYWSYQLNWCMGGVVFSVNGLLSRLELVEVQDYVLFGCIGGCGVLLVKFGDGVDGLVVVVVYLLLGVGLWMLQLGFIVELLFDYFNVVLMGDFNCLVECLEMQVLYQKIWLQLFGCIVLIFLSWCLDCVIDYILVSSGLQICIVEVILVVFFDYFVLVMQIDVLVDVLC